MAENINKEYLNLLIDDEFGQSKIDYINFYKQCGRFLKHHPVVETETINNHRYLFRFIYQTYTFINELPAFSGDKYDHQQFAPVREVVFNRSQQTINIITMYYAYLLTMMTNNISCLEIASNTDIIPINISKSNISRSNLIYELVVALAQSSVVSFVRYCNLRYCGYPNSFSYLSHLYRRYEDASLMISILNLLFKGKLNDHITNQWERHSFQLLFLFNQPAFKELFIKFLEGHLTIDQLINSPTIYQHFNPELLENYKFFLVEYLFKPLANLTSNSYLIIKNNKDIRNRFHFIHHNYMQFKFINYGSSFDDRFSEAKSANDEENALLIRKFYHLTKIEFLSRLRVYLQHNEVILSLDDNIFKKLKISFKFQQLVNKLQCSNVSDIIKANAEIESIIHLFDHYIMNTDWEIPSDLIIPILKVY